MWGFVKLLYAQEHRVYVTYGQTDHNYRKNFALKKKDNEAYDIIQRYYISFI